MNILELGAMGELVGGVAVVASLLFVGFQVRQGSRAAQQSAYNSDARILQDFGLALARDKALARILRVIVRGDPSELDEDEQVQLEWFVHQWMYAFEASFRSFQDGLIHRDQWESKVDNALQVLAAPTFLQVARTRPSELAQATLAEIEQRARHHGRSVSPAT